MKPKSIVIILVIASLLFAGCVENGVVPDDNETDDNVTPGDNETPDNNITPPDDNDTDVNVTPDDNDTDVNVTPDDNETVNDTPTEPKSVSIRMQHFAFIPSKVEINKGDTVIWQNFQTDPSRPFTIVSEDRLWENTTVTYRRSFSYTFNETGMYNFSTRAFPQRMSGTITVK